MNINRNNYEEYFINYMENELSDAERKAVEIFVTENPDLRNELELFESTRLVANEKIIFANKNELLKKEETKIIVWKWNLNKWAIAAMLILAVGTGWWMFQSSVESTRFSVKKENNKPNVAMNQKPILNVRDGNQKKEIQMAEKKSIVKSCTHKKIESIIIHEHRDCIAQDIYPIELLIKTIDTLNKQQVALVDTTIHSKPNRPIGVVEKIEPILVETQLIKKEEHVLASLPVKTNSTQRQIIKALAWLGGKISGNNSNDGNFNIDLGFAEINHKEALAKN